MVSTKPTRNRPPHPVSRRPVIRPKAPANHNPSPIRPQGSPKSSKEQSSTTTPRPNVHDRTNTHSSPLPSVWNSALASWCAGKSRTSCVVSWRSMFWSALRTRSLIGFIGPVLEIVDGLERGGGGPEIALILILGKWGVLIGAALGGPPSSPPPKQNSY